MEFRSSDVMAYILKYCNDKGIQANKTKAQKLLYCCYGLYLAKFDKRLTDEHPKAWMYGPVFPRTFNDINKSRLTEEMAKSFAVGIRADEINGLELINKTIDTFGIYSANALSNWSHLEDSPWSKADPLASLDDREIASYFKPYIAIVEGINHGTN